MSIYKNFATGDVVLGDLAVVSTAVWSEEVNPLTTFFTASNSSSYEYYVPVYNKNPQTDTSAAVQFSVAYGHIKGSGSLGDTTIVDTTNSKPSKVIYSQYKALLLEPTVNKFVFGTDTPDDIFVVNLNRARYKQKLDPGNWQLKITNSTFIDGSGAGQNPVVNQSGRVFNVYSGSGGVTSSNDVYGLAYPDLGIIVLDALKIESATSLTVTRNDTAAKNAVELFKEIKVGAYFAARTEERISSNYYFVRVTNQESNYSNNPSFVTGSTGELRWSAMLQNPHTYITTVGLYDNTNNLLAVAKLSRPLLKTFNREALIKVKIDF